MQGLELAEHYFRAYGRPLLETQFASVAHLIAAGMVGPGSECLGFDDHMSRDHDWGPGFCLWIEQADFDRFGNRLQAAYERLPHQFMGTGPRRVSPGEEHRVGVIGIQQFYRTYTGLDHPPVTTREWLQIPETGLATCTNGRIFQDSSDRFSAWRRALQQFYPETIRVYKIAAGCVTAAQAGQYNFLRSLKRQDWFALRYAEIQFCDEVLRLAFLLNRRYAPFYKWRHRAVRSLPKSGKAIYDGIAEILASADDVGKQEKMDQICYLLVQEMRRQGLTESSSTYLLDQVPSLGERIDDPQLRRRFSMLAGHSA